MGEQETAEKVLITISNILYYFVFYRGRAITPKTCVSFNYQFSYLAIYVRVQLKGRDVRIKSVLHPLGQFTDLGCRNRLGMTH